MKYLFATVLCLLVTNAFGSVNCSGVPTRVYAGAHGPDGAGYKYWVVFSNWETYLLGNHDDDLAKSRFSLAQTALVASKTLELSFYSHTACEQVRTDKAQPTAAALVQ